MGPPRENLGAGLLGDTARFLPGQAAHGLAQASQAGAISSPVTAAVLLLAYAMLAAGAAVLRMARTRRHPHLSQRAAATLVGDRGGRPGRKS